MNLHEMYENYMDASATRKIVLFGAGANGMRNRDRYLINEEIYCYSDNDPNKWGTNFDGLKVVEPEKLLREKDDLVIVITSMYFQEIFHQLSEMGFQYIFSGEILQLKTRHSYSLQIDSYKFIVPDMVRWDYTEGFAYKQNIKIINDNKDKIEHVRSFLSDDKSKTLFNEYIKKIKYNYVDYTDVMEVGRQYFDADLFSYTSDEVFIDAGCFDANTSIDFAKEVNFKFQKIYAFEPDKVSYKKSLDNFKKHDQFENKYELYNWGLSDKNDTLKFNEYGDIRSGISQSGTTTIRVVRLDDIVKDRVTFIKMDIEGAEISALYGSYGLIQEHSPKLAISIYHRLEDLWEIPLLVKQMNPDYKIYMRHYCAGPDEKVMYATL